jgi:hypothetical protein
MRLKGRGGKRAHYVQHFIIIILFNIVIFPLSLILSLAPTELSFSAENKHKTMNVRIFILFHPILPIVGMCESTTSITISFT